MSLALRARQPPSKPHHGKFIYLYSNLRTNQVIYSLEREIHTEKQERTLLTQLPFYAKKTVPTKIRKDHWRPFATVTFPDPALGLHAFKLLKEYRMVRDHSWTVAAPRHITKVVRTREPTHLVSKPVIDKATGKPVLDENGSTIMEDVEEKTGEVVEDGEEVAAFKIGEKRIEKKGVDGKPSTHQWIKDYPQKLPLLLEGNSRDAGQWPSRKDRAKLVMDQRATSVADLSHIISRQLQPIEGPTRKEERKVAERTRLWGKIQKLAETSDATTKILEEERTNLEAATEVAPSHKQPANRLAEKTKLKKRRQRIAEITSELNRIRKAREAVLFAKGGEVDELTRSKWSKTLKYIVQMQNPDRPVMPGYDHNANLAKKEQAANARPSNWPKSTTFDNAAKPKAFSTRDKIALRDHKPEVDARIDLDLPTSSILIEWANLSDAQFAHEWHGEVVHGELVNKLATKAELATERQRAAYEMQQEWRAQMQEQRWEDKDAGAERTALGEKYRSKGGVGAEEGGKKTGWLGGLNPMRLFKGGEARA